MKATEDISRLFKMVPWLAAHPGISVKEAAAEFGITPQRLLHELETMWMIGSDPDSIASGFYEYLLEYDPDEAEAGRVVVTPSPYIARPLRLTVDEALSLLVALKSVQPLVDDESAGHVGSAIKKLEETTGHRTGHVQLAMDVGAEDVRSVLHTAISAGQRLQLVYDGVNRGITTRPEVDPAAIIVRNGSAYLQAWSLTRQDWRLYKVNRIAEASATGEPAHDHGSPPEVDWADTASVVELHLAAAALYLLEYDPVRESGELDDPVYLRWARVPLADRSYLSHRLLQLADQIRLPEPHQAQQDAVTVAEAALAAYAELPASNAAGARVGA
ncbi:helix-turn-helix transcriptional regulator [Propionibacteriaceae bacterium Y1923]